MIYDGFVRITEYNDTHNLTLSAIWGWYEHVRYIKAKWRQPYCPGKVQLRKNEIPTTLNRTHRAD